MLAIDSYNNGEFDPSIPRDDPPTELPLTEEDRLLEASGDGSEQAVISAAQQRNTTAARSQRAAERAAATTAGSSPRPAAQPTSPMEMDEPHAASPPAAATSGEVGGAGAVPVGVAFNSDLDSSDDSLSDSNSNPEQGGGESDAASALPTNAASGAGPVIGAAPVTGNCRISSKKIDDKKKQTADSFARIEAGIAKWREELLAAKQEDARLAAKQEEARLAAKKRDAKREAVHLAKTQALLEAKREEERLAAKQREDAATMLEENGGEDESDEEGSDESDDEVVLQHREESEGEATGATPPPSTPAVQYIVKRTGVHFRETLVGERDRNRRFAHYMQAQERAAASSEGVVAASEPSEASEAAAEHGEGCELAADESSGAVAEGQHGEGGEGGGDDKAKQVRHTHAQPSPPSPPPLPPCTKPSRAVPLLLAETIVRLLWLWLARPGKGEAQQQPQDQQPLSTQARLPIRSVPCVGAHSGPDPQAGCSGVARALHASAALHGHAAHWGVRELHTDTGGYAGRLAMGGGADSRGRRAWRDLRASQPQRSVHNESDGPRGCQGRRDHGFGGQPAQTERRRDAEECCGEGCHRRARRCRGAADSSRAPGYRDRRQTRCMLGHRRACGCACRSADELPDLR